MNVTITINKYLKEKEITNTKKIMINLEDNSGIKSIIIGKDRDGDILLNSSTITKIYGKIQVVNGKMMYTSDSQHSTIILSKKLGKKELKNRSNLYIEKGDRISLPDDKNSSTQLIIE